MATYTNRPIFVEAWQFFSNLIEYDQTHSPNASYGKKDEEQIFHHCPENDPGYRWFVKGPHGKHFYIRDGDYAISLPEGGWGVFPQLEFEGRFVPCPV